VILPKARNIMESPDAPERARMCFFLLHGGSQGFESPRFHSRLKRQVRRQIFRGNLHCHFNRSNGAAGA
jgi:hypothetical protein